MLRPELQFDHHKHWSVLSRFETMEFNTATQNNESTAPVHDAIQDARRDLRVPTGVVAGGLHIAMSGPTA